MNADRPISRRAIAQWPLLRSKWMLSFEIILTFVGEKPTSVFLDFAMMTTDSHEASAPSEQELSPEIDFAILRLREFFESSDIASLQPNSPNTVYTTLLLSGFLSCSDSEVASLRQQRSKK